MHWFRPGSSSSSLSQRTVSSAPPNACLMRPMGPKSPADRVHRPPLADAALLLGQAGILVQGHARAYVDNYGHDHHPLPVDEACRE